MAMFTREEVLEKCRGITCFNLVDVVGRTKLKNIRWLQSVGIVPNLNLEHFLCWQTEDPDHRLRLRSRSDRVLGYMIYCNTCRQIDPQNAKKERSLVHNTWLSGTHLSPMQVIQVTFAFVMRLGVYQTAHHVQINHSTVIDWFNFCRGVCRDAVALSYQNVTPMVGGDGHIVEVSYINFT